MVELADRVGRDYTTVSRQVAKLEETGLAKRQKNAKDKRINEAVITPAKLKKYLSINYLLLKASVCKCEDIVIQIVYLQEKVAGDECYFSNDYLAMNQHPADKMRC